MVPGRSLVLAAFIAFAGPLDLLTCFAGCSSPHKMAYRLTHRGEKRERPQDGGRRVGDLKGPEFQFAHAGHQRHGGAKGA